MKIQLVTFAVLLMTGCMSAAEHSASLHSAEERKLTLGIVQRDIKKGMPQSDVALALGSPNIVNRDSQGLETWIYDKVSSETSYSKSDGSVGGLLGAAADVGSALILGGGAGSYSESSGAQSTSQKTLTVVVRFDASGNVSTSQVHSSSF